MAQPSSGEGKTSNQNHHFAESFIVSQLKKNNRDLKMEVQEKDRLIEQLKRNIKMSKSNEIEIELTVYIDECLRLRQQLEQAYMEKQMIL
jgi:predicted RNase H-like nuclease (RuvC/YqgF family)